MTGKITSLDCTSDGAQRIFRESHYGRRRRVVFVAAATAIGTLLPTAAFSPPVISRMAHINSHLLSKRRKTKPFSIQIK